LQVDGEHTVLIFDLGGGTFDASILTIDNGIFEVKSTAGDTHLGGEDFDNRMVEYFVQEFKRKYKKDLTSNKRAVTRLRTTCKYAKHTLSSFTRAPIKIDSRFEGTDFCTSITQSIFEEMNADLFVRTVERVVKSLRDARMDKALLNRILIVGGSAKISNIRNLLIDFFSEKKFIEHLFFDEAVVCGAALYTAFLDSDKLDLHLFDVTPRTLGFETSEGLISELINHNTFIPTPQTDPVS
jgi:L1 cell adhesion molecule like protein